MLSVRDIQTLHDFKNEQEPVLSVYLDLSNPHGAHVELKSVVKDALTRTVGLRDRPADMERAAKLVEATPNWNGARGLAIFACAEHLWIACPLPQTVKSLVRLGPTPYLAPLLNILDQYRRYGVLLLSPEGTRVVEIFLGQARELEAPLTRPPRPGQGGVESRLKDAADQLMIHSRRWHLERLIVSAPAGWETPLIGQLHTFIQDNLIVDQSLSPTMTLEEVLAAVRLAENQARAVRESVLVNRLLEATRRKDSDAVVGLSGTLQALNRGAARMVLVRDGLARMGRRCPHCGSLALTGKKCLSCWLDTEPIINIVAEMIQLALDQNCEVIRLMHETRLDSFGDIGAELRSKLDSPASVESASPLNVA
jgi:peptide chain release factor subunit 1